MLTSPSPKSKVKPLERQRSPRPRPPRVMVILLGVVALTALIAIAWFNGAHQLPSMAEPLHRWLASPSIGLALPMPSVDHLLVWAVLPCLVVLGIMRLSPQPQSWSRIAVALIWLSLTLVYVGWRVLFTLNLSTPLNASFSLALLVLELLVLFNNIIQLCLLLLLKDQRSLEADQKQRAVLAGHFQPSVDILIPTYNEPAFMLRRAVIGCQAIDYGPKTVYLLDDTRRPEIQALAASLGCEYLTRPDNRHAKAGNLNHAIAHTQSDLIVVFDADFVPTRNFLNRTVGFFQDPKVGLVQTPQNFYNADPIARNLGLDQMIPPDEEIFYRYVQPLKEAAGSVVCAGTSFIVRRTALESSGGFFTGALAEDYYTGIRISAQGYRLVYLNEKLSAGLAAENMAAYALQRLRWARGTLQAFFIQANPLTIPGLGFWQRLAHFEGILNWFNSLSKVFFLLVPLAYAFLGVIPLRATSGEILLFFVPYYLVYLTAFSWLNHRSRSALLSDIYALVLAFPLALTVIQTLLRPFSHGFKVTPKGQTSDRLTFNWMLAWPLMLLFGFTALSLWLNLGHSIMIADWRLSMSPEVAVQTKGIGLGWIWSAYNLVMIGIVLLVLLDLPRLDVDVWLDLRQTVRLQVGQQNFWGITRMLSEAGAEIELTQMDLTPQAVGLPIRLELLEAGLVLPGILTQVDRGNCDRFPQVRVGFDSLSLPQQRCLIELLFCRPGQWKQQHSPGEFQALWLLLRSLLKPKALFHKQAPVRAVAVTKT